MHAINKYSQHMTKQKNLSLFYVKTTHTHYLREQSNMGFVNGGEKQTWSILLRI